MSSYEKYERRPNNGWFSSADTKTVMDIVEEICIFILWICYDSLMLYSGRMAILPSKSLDLVSACLLALS